MMLSDILHEILYLQQPLKGEFEERFMCPFSEAVA